MRNKFLSHISFRNFTRIFANRIILGLFIASFVHSSFSSNVMAQTPTAQGAVVALFTPFSFFQKSLQSIMTHYSTQTQAQLPDQILNVSGLNWNISGISYSVQSDFTQGNLLPGSYDIQSRNLKLAISVQQISVDQVITTQEGGITLDVHVQALCGPVTLVQNSASATARISYQFTPQSISTQVTQLNFQWPAQTWAISQLNCQGPHGIDSKIQAALGENLQSADSLKPYIQNALSAKIQDQVDEILGQIKRPTPIVVAGNPLNLVLSFQKFQITPLGLLTYGQISWNGTPSADHISGLTLNSVPLDLANAASPVLITANAGWESLIKAELAAIHGPTLVNLNQQDSFRQLLKSNFIDFFLWPDLMNYRLSSPFNLAIDTPNPDALTWLQDGSAQFQTTASAWVQSVRDNKTWNYLRMTGNTNIDLAPQIANGTFSVVAKVHASNIQGHFGDDYVAAYHPAEYLSPIVIFEITKYLNRSFLLTVPLPSYDLGSVGKAVFDGWTPISGGSLVSIPVKMQLP